MIEKFEFSLKFKNIHEQNSHKYTFPTGLHIIYGESNVGKSELIQLLTKTVQSCESELFVIENCNILNNKTVITQNPDMQIIGTTIEQELAFSFECHSNDSNEIQSKLKKIKNNLLFRADLNRHPNTLSGGEKELLNIATAISQSSKVLLIDDSLSFLSSAIKERIIRKIFSKYTEQSIILWFTSDDYDLKFGDTKWEMTHSTLIPFTLSRQIKFPKVILPPGKLSLFIDNLDFSYDNQQQIFNNFSISKTNFRCLGITGENGSGKSTLAALLSKLEKPNAGNIKLNCRTRDRINIGYLDQFPEKTLGILSPNDFIKLLIKNNKLAGSQIQNISATMKSMDIDWREVNNLHAMDLPWTTLRIILIVILTNCKYDLLILDEPTFGMGNHQKQILFSYFNRYLMNKHLILISHDSKFIDELCDSKITLENNGK